MAMKHIQDWQVIFAYRRRKAGDPRYPYEILQEMTGECEKVCYRAMERAYDRGFIECGVSLRTGWITDEGHKELQKHYIPS